MWLIKGSPMESSNFWCIEIQMKSFCRNLMFLFILKWMNWTMFCLFRGILRWIWLRKSMWTVICWAIFMFIVRKIFMRKFMLKKMIWTMLFCWIQTKESQEVFSETCFSWKEMWLKFLKLQKEPTFLRWWKILWLSFINKTSQKFRNAKWLVLNHKKPRKF